MNAPRNPRDFLFNVDFVKYMEILSAQRAFIAVFCTSAVLTALALTYAFSEMYLSTATIHYRPVDTSLLRPRSSESFGAPIPSAPFKIISQTLSDIVKSEAIIRPVVEELHLDQEIQKHYDVWYKRWFYATKKAIKAVAKDAWQLLKYGRFVEESSATSAVQGLADAISISSTKDSYIYVLSVKDQDPERAARIVDAVGAQLVRWSRQQDHNPFESKAERLSSEVKRKDAELTSLRSERDGILLSSNVVSISEEVNTGVQSLYGMKVDLERVVAQINEKQKRLDEIRRTISDRQDRYIDPDHLKRLQEERLFAEIEIKSLDARRASLQASINRLEQKLQFVLSIKKKVDDIDAKIETVTREGQHIGDMQLEATEAKTRESEVTVLHRANVSATPVQPIKIYHVGLTAFLSLVFSVGLVYVFSYFNIRVFFPSRKPHLLDGFDDSPKAADG